MAARTGILAYGGVSKEVAVEEPPANGNKTLAYGGVASAVETRRRGAERSDVPASQRRHGLTRRDSPLQGEHPVADMHSAEDIAELGDRVREHSDNMGYNSFDQYMRGQRTPGSIEELRQQAGAFVRAASATTPIFQPHDRYLTES